MLNKTVSTKLQRKCWKKSNWGQEARFIDVPVILPQEMIKNMLEIDDDLQVAASEGD